MSEENESRSGPGWSATQVYIMAAICLVLGTALGYLFRGSKTPPTAVSASSQSGQPGMPGQGGMGQQMPSLDQMKQMADKKAEPLLAQLKTDPKNVDVLKQVATIYESTHQFKEAADYFGKAVEVNPQDVPTRTSMASCLYFAGDVDGALDQLQQALKIDPKDANSLFNLGMIRLRGKNDNKGAVQAWDQLLKSNPNLDSGKKAEVKKLIAEAKQIPVS
jgi:cytochrome c-type biogenesis protein CcmH/NrfG